MLDERAIPDKRSRASAKDTSIMVIGTSLPVSEKGPNGRSSTSSPNRLVHAKF